MKVMFKACAAHGLRFRHALIALSLTLVGNLCIRDDASAQEAAPQRAPMVVAILVDSMRWDEVDPIHTPHLTQLATEGVRGEMVPIWPTITHPNHWALATGLYTEHSGVLANYMYDSRTGQSYPETRQDPAWYRGEPIWATVAKQGQRSVVVDTWVGALNAGDNLASAFIDYRPIDFNHDQRAEIALAMLDQEPPRRPNFMTLYFGELDEVQHEHGVGSPEALDALERTDAEIGQLMSGLAERHLRETVNIIIVADHGMTNVPANHHIDLDALVHTDELERAPLGYWGTQTYLWPVAGSEQRLYERLRRAAHHFQVWRRDDVPSRFHWGDPDRTAPIILVPDPGWVIQSRSEDPWIGFHGFDNRMRDMHAIFIAAGPSIRPGATVAPFSSVDVYSLMATLLRVRPAANDGSIQSLCPALIDPPSECERR